MFEGRYRVEGVIGEGGMGRVLRATEVDSGRPVAIKVLRRVLNEAQTQRFAREGQLTAGFQHPGIVRVYGGGLTAAGHPFLVLELLEDAVSLDVAWQRQPARKLDLLLEVTLAVAYAHRCGIVHRDLKPDNVLVPADGRPRVCDFGLAWQSGVTDLTKTGQLLGTPLYMAPERFREDAHMRDPGLDVWSLGVMLYLALTGVHPLQPRSGNLLELVALTANHRITPPSSIADGVSPAVEAVCLRALARDPLDRYADAGALAEALEAALASAPGRAGSARLAWLGAGAGLAALALSAAAWWTEPGPPPASPTEAPAARPTPRADPSGEPSPTRALPPADSAAARARLPALLQRAHLPAPLDPELVRAFRSLAVVAREDAPLRDRIELERLDYLFRRGRWAETLEPLRGFAARPAGDLGDRAAVLLGLALYELGRREDGAEACRRRRARARRDSVWSRTVAAWEHVLARRGDPGLRQARAVLQESPAFPAALLAASCAHGLMLQLEQSRRYLIELRPHAPDHPTRFRLEVAVAIHLQERAQAIRYMQQLIALLEPRPHASVLLDYASLLYSDRKERTAVQPALKVIGRVLKHEPQHLRGRFLQAVLRIEGEIFVEQQLTELRGLRDRHPAAFEELMGFVDPLAFRRKIRNLLDPN